MDKWDVRTIEEIAIEIYCGAEVTADQLETGDWPAIKCRDINSQLGSYFKECISFIDPNLIKRKRYFEFGDILVGRIGDEKTIGTATTYLGKQKGIAGDHVYVIKHKQNPKFLSYILSSKYCRKQINSKSTKGTIVRLFYITSLKQIQVPLPPIETQEQIVSMLEKLDHQMTNLEQDIKELMVERQQQCHYLTKKTIN